MVVLVVSCSVEQLRPTAYMSWMENPDNGFIATKTVSGITFSLQYKPYNYMALMKFKTADPDRKEFEKTKTEYGNLQYYTLRVSSADQQDLLRAQEADNLEYFQRLEYLVGHMQDQLTLIDGKDTLPCLLYHYERNYGLAPHSDFLLGFASSATTTPTDRTLVLNDELFGTGPIYLTITGKALRREPQLQL